MSTARELFTARTVLPAADRIQRQLFRWGARLTGPSRAVVRTDDVAAVCGGKVVDGSSGETSPEAFASLDWDEDHVIALLPAPSPCGGTPTRLGLLSRTSGGGIWWMTDYIPGATAWEGQVSIRLETSRLPGLGAVGKTLAPD